MNKTILLCLLGLQSVAAPAQTDIRPPDFDPEKFPIAGTSTPPVIETVVVYKLKGDRPLYPGRITDDGERTYIEWDRDVEMPAVFALNEQGQEILVDGYMRGGLYTIDRVYPQILFRLDRGFARAIRSRAARK